MWCSQWKRLLGYKLTVVTTVGLVESVSLRQGWPNNREVSLWKERFKHVESKLLQHVHSWETNRARTTSCYHFQWPPVTFSWHLKTMLRNGIAAGQRHSFSRIQRPFVTVDNEEDNALVTDTRTIRPTGYCTCVCICEKEDHQFKKCERLRPTIKFAVSMLSETRAKGTHPPGVANFGPLWTLISF